MCGFSHSGHDNHQRCDSQPWGEDSHSPYTHTSLAHSHTHISSSPLPQQHAPPPAPASVVGPPTCSSPPSHVSAPAPSPHPYRFSPVMCHPSPPAPLSPVPSTLTPHLRTAAATCRCAPMPHVPHRAARQYHAVTPPQPLLPAPPFCSLLYPPQPQW